MAVDLTGGVKLKLKDEPDTAKDSAVSVFARDAAIAAPLPDPLTEASRVRISSEDGNAGWFDLDMALWKPVGTKGYKYSDKLASVAKIVLTTANGQGKLLLRLKGEGYGRAALAGPEDHVEVRLQIGATAYCGRFETGLSLVKKNEAGNVLLLGPSTGCVAPVTKRVFVTSSTYTGDLGGLVGADAKCQAHADAAALGGTWKAWLSTSSEDARDRITDGHYTLVDGTIVANSLADLTNGGIWQAIELDEYAVVFGSNQAWTGTLANGTWYDADCQAWTSALPADTALIGYVNLADELWTDGFPSADCSYTDVRGVYCFEQ